MRSISILGIRGIPACHGGFETFAEILAPYLQEKGWQVTVYCQVEGSERIKEEEFWQGIRLVKLRSRFSGPLGTIVFDLESMLDALSRGSMINLTLGYNTAVLGIVYRLLGHTNIFNMDGLEWMRRKWSMPVRTWFYVNEWLACWFGNRLIADHPEILRRLRSRGVAKKKMTMIPYGADCVNDAPASVLSEYGLKPGGYTLLIARVEPENSILELVTAYSAKPRGLTLVVLGAYDTLRYRYHAAIKQIASNEVLFLGAIFDKGVVAALRFHAVAYFHGHQVGGTNPSLVEAMGAGCPVLAHDNPFNRWVAGEAALYFSNVEECKSRIDLLLGDADRLAEIRRASVKRHAERFTLPATLAEYEGVLLEACNDRLPEHLAELSGDSASADASDIS